MPETELRIWFFLLIWLIAKAQWHKLMVSLHSCPSACWQFSRVRAISKAFMHLTKHSYLQAVYVCQPENLEAFGIISGYSLTCVFSHEDMKSLISLNGLLGPEASLFLRGVQQVVLLWAGTSSWISDLLAGHVVFFRPSEHLSRPRFWMFLVRVWLCRGWGEVSHSGKRFRKLGNHWFLSAVSCVGQSTPGLGSLFLLSAKSHVDIYNIICGPCKMINLKIGFWVPYAVALARLVQRFCEPDTPHPC